MSDTPHGDHAVTSYTRQTAITDPGPHRELLNGLPTDIPGLCQIVRGLILHPATAHLYDVQVDPARLAEQDTRDVASIISRIVALDPAPLSVARPPKRRFVGCCRDFSTVVCALLRDQGVPARPRAGCARYFSPGYNVDHWICEVWRPASSDQADTKEPGARRRDTSPSAGEPGTNSRSPRQGSSRGVSQRESHSGLRQQGVHSGAGRWVMVDAQLDDAHCTACGIPFDPHDVPADQFLVAGEAWQRCRSGAADPETFGVAPHVPEVPVRGWRYLQSQLVRDFAALNGVELLCWDLWGLADAREPATSTDLDLLDRVAALSLASDSAAFAERRALYEAEPRLRVPGVITSLEAASGWQTTREVVLAGE